MEINRRKFLKIAGSVGVGAAAIGHANGGQGANERIALRPLGRTGIQLMPLGFGAQRTRDSELIRYAIDQGVDHIETSWSYGFGKPDNSCQCIGKAIAGIRENVHLLVAYEGRMKLESKGWVGNQLEQTLRDLGTDYIDVFLWHQPEGIDQIVKGPQIDLMQQWKSQGKIRWCGVTAHENQELYLKYVAESSVYDVAVVAFNYNSSPELAAAIEEAAKKGVGVIAMKTQSPNYNRGEEPVIGDAPDHRKALQWALSKNYVTSAIPGMTTREQVDMNLEVVKGLAF